jgi:uncharacterized protein involved in type VI secretion and phage assembly
MSRRENGILIATVIDLDDPEKLGRVRVKYPQYDDQPSTWARVVSPMAGPSRGFFFRPEVGDEVLIAFQNGDPRSPYVLGALWSKADPPPPDDGAATKNNWRFIVSRSGHVVKLDDTSGAEKIEIVDKSGKLKIVLDSANAKIEIENTQGDISFSASTGTFSVKAKTVEIKATADMTLEATGTTTLKGSTVNIN